MEGKGAEIRFLVLVFLLFRFSLAEGGERELLLSFKASVTDPLRFLSSWNSSSDLCNWHGISCNHASYVAGIELSGKNLSGNLSSSLFLLPLVESINLSNNVFFGELPREMFSTSSVSSLLHLNLSSNNFSGPIPIPHSTIPTLQTLDLSNNMFSGEIPAQIAAFSGLKYLDLGGNVLGGKIPKSISDLENLQFLTLAANEIVGGIPPEIGLMKNLQWIYFGYNNLSGEIPRELGNLTSLNHLDLVYNNLTGEIPLSLGSLRNLSYLFLYQNKLSGPIPLSLFDLENLVSLDLSDNSLSGEISDRIIHLQNLEILQLFSNNLTGKIPRALASLPRLQVLALWSNRISGEIPNDLGFKNNLTVVDLSTNNLTGQIPSSLCNSGRLFKLILFSNSLQGTIPANLSLCRSLQRVRVQNNRLSGELPQEFTKLPLVYYLDLSGNDLTGRIDDRKWDMPSLQMLALASNLFFGRLPEYFGSEKLESLDLSENRFSGGIPARFGDLRELMQLKLSRNQLVGLIPDEISSCKKLVNLDLSRNQLSGSIPAGLSKMPVLGELDLSENSLSGKIPPDLGKVESLVLVNISYNHFFGGLPLTAAFLAVNSSAVAGNDGLCGGGIGGGLPPCKAEKRTFQWPVVSALAGFLLFVALFVFVVLVLRRRKVIQRKKVDNEEGVWELQFFDKKAHNSISVEDILSSVTEENAICNGRNGVLYKGRSSVKSFLFAAKKLTEAPSLPSAYWTEINRLGSFRHPNIVRLLGACRSEKEGLLVFEYIEGSSLREALHVASVQKLGWEKRLKIAIGIAKALRFLHCVCSPAVFHGNICPEKVILDEMDEPHLRLNLPASHSSDSKGFESSCGYRAPEGVDQKELTEKSDVYSLGILLIDLLTGRTPAGPELGAQSIVEWARYCYSDCHLDTWVDPAMKDSLLAHQSEMVRTMSLALKCTHTDPSSRPRTSDVLKAMEFVRRPEGCWASKVKISVPI